jgi:hypothetical protein
LFSDLLAVVGTWVQPLTYMNASHQLGIKYGDFKVEVAIHASLDRGNVNAYEINRLLKIILHELD